MIKPIFVLFAALGIASACSTPAPAEIPLPGASARVPAAAPSPPTSAAVPPAVAPSTWVGAPPLRASGAAPDALAEPASEAIPAAAAEAILFLRAAAVPAAATACPRADRESRIRCLLGLRFEGDPAAAAAAIELFTASGDIAGVEPEQVMDGGFRGQIRLVPEAPVGPYRRHLLWTLEASRDFGLFFAGIGKAAPAKMRYRARDLAYRFFRSVQRTTPSAYAQGWTIAYNVSGSLHSSAAAVRETLFHEIFHLNDAAHGDWSRAALGAIFDGIVKKCGTRVACLKPYAPGDTMVKGGTYYAFQPDNGDAVHEYAAELASRYYLEHRAILRKEAPDRGPFKCGPEENRRAWQAIASEFFGGADLTAACPR